MTDLVAPEGRYALVIAISEYDDPKLRQLRSPAADAQRLAEVLSNPNIGGFEVETTDLDEEEAALRRRIARFFSNRRPDDLLLIHLSCHGVKDEDGELYFAAKDTELGDLLGATGISSTWLTRQLGHSRSKRVVVLLDCCFSGSFPFGLRARAGEEVNVREHLEGKGRAVITASNALEYAYEGDELSGEPQPSIFTDAIVEGLESGKADRNGDKWISVDELYDYVYDRVQERTPTQTPNKMSSIEGSLHVARSVYDPPIEPAELAPDLVALIEHSQTGARIGAVDELKRLLASSNRAVALAAHLALEKMVDDDSRTVAANARKALNQSETKSVPRTFEAGEQVALRDVSVTDLAAEMLALLRSEMGAGTAAQPSVGSDASSERSDGDASDSKSGSETGPLITATPVVQRQPKEAPQPEASEDTAAVDSVEPSNAARHDVHATVAELADQVLARRDRDRSELRVVSSALNDQEVLVNLAWGNRGVRNSARGIFALTNRRLLFVYKNTESLDDWPLKAMTGEATRSWTDAVKVTFSEQKVVLDQLKPRDRAEEFRSQMNLLARGGSTGDPQSWSPIVAVSLGARLEEQGDLEGAEAAYQRAIDSSHRDVAPVATMRLGFLLKKEGDRAAAEVALRSSIASGHSDAAPRAGVGLGSLLADRGDLEGAQLAFRQVVDSGHEDAAPRAMFLLGALLEDEQDDLEGAKAAYQRAIDSGHRGVTPVALMRLGFLLKKEGDTAAAEVALRSSIASGHSDAAPRAEVGLGMLLSDRGDVTGAQLAFRRVIDSGHEDAAPRAMFLLGLLLEEQGDLEGAKASYQRAIDSAHEAAAPAARERLELLQDDSAAAD